jgi:hypothetical protein
MTGFSGAESFCNIPHRHNLGVLRKLMLFDPPESLVILWTISETTECLERN